MDENFDGRISYNELKEHIKKQGFQLSKDVISDNKKGTVLDTFVWRDKSLELIIRLLNNNLNKQPFEEFFKKFDGDHDNYLTPAEFRSSLLSMKNNQLKKF